MPGTAYSIKFIGHLKEPRPLGWPMTFEQDLYVEVEGLEGLRNATSQQLIHIIRVNGGLIVVKPEFRNKVHNAEFTPDVQMFMPLHMFSHFTTETKRITGAFPDDARKDEWVKN